MAIKGRLVATEEFHAVDVIALGRKSGVLGIGPGTRGAGEGLPGLDEVEVIIVGTFGVGGAYLGVLE